MTITPQPLKFNSGIQRDGTRLTAPGNWIDGQWVRFVNGRPRKMLGYREMTASSDGVPRSFENHFKGGTHYLHIGSTTNLRQLQFNQGGAVTGLPTIRTPGSYTMQGNELWQFGVAYDPIVANAATMFAHPGRNLNDISNTVNTPIFSGDAAGTSTLTQLTGLASVSGGICVVHPYLTFFGSDGYFGWSAPNNFNDQTTVNGGGSAYPTSQKIIRGFPISGGNGPSGLYFSLNAVIRTNFVGGSATWTFDTLSDETTIVSSRAVTMARNDIAFWMGTDGFYQYDGRVTELANTYCSDWVFDNLNQAERQKCFAFANTRWGEIWFCFPYGSATECTHAAVFNYRTNEWYSTILPNGGRAGALMPGLYPRPIMGGVEAVSGSYRIWDHESGYDEQRGTSIVAIRSFIESSDVSLTTGEQPQNRTVSCTAVEPDVKQVGPMTLTVTGNANARAPDMPSDTITFQPGPVTGSDQVLRFKAERRQLRFRWESNVAGGYYELGLPIAHIGTGSGRELG